MNDIKKVPGVLSGQEITELVAKNIICSDQ
jgi:hypothetical protein